MQHQRRDFKKQGGHFDRPDWSSQVKSDWVTYKIDEDAVKFSEKFGNYLANNRLTTSQIRNIYGELKRIQMKGFDEERTSFLLLLPKMAYAAKRNSNEGLNALKKVFDILHKNVKTAEQYNNMMNLMEAILAYHKAFGGKEN
ncbi:MAG TPA: type III-A CRISPR-associated protein Csm2 [Mariniphaga anaerophila]|uniref:CRISPR system Cms protein Csm2 n=1 Tax=Mariniphaga anaerophila TaxID=1484053 RepID=A0A831LZZ5_9BACT|nr:type III-A CRISPR-associated protein Csm2 [Mariniphaga anaerophila]